MQENRGKSTDRKLAILKRAKGTWDIIFELLGIQLSTTPINEEVLTDLKNPMTQAILKIYSLEFWIANEINLANTAKDNSKI